MFSPGLSDFPSHEYLDRFTVPGLNFLLFLWALIILGNLMVKTKMKVLPSYHLNIVLIQSLLLFIGFRWSMVSERRIRILQE